MEKTIFIEQDGTLVDEWIVTYPFPIPLYLGMEITFKKSQVKFKIQKWSYEQGKGLTIELSRTGEMSNFRSLG